MPIERTYENWKKPTILGAILSLSLVGILWLDVRSDFRAGVPYPHIRNEVLMIAFAIFAIGFITAVRHKVGVKRSGEALAPLRTNDDHRFDRFAERYRLSPTEKEITLYLLKGLSHREIADLRNTREHTVRQQAQGVYAKTDVHSKAELSALFFEDMI